MLPGLLPHDDVPLVCHKGMPVLRELNLDNNGVGDAGMAELLPGLRGSSQLKRLSLRHNNIGEGGAVALAQYLGKQRDVGMLFSDSDESLESGGSSGESDSSDRHDWTTTLHVDTAVDGSGSDTSSVLSQASHPQDEGVNGRGRHRHHHYHHRPGLNELDLAWNCLSGRPAGRLLRSIADSRTLEVRSVLCGLRCVRQ